jgi:hypothetical protein
MLDMQPPAHTPVIRGTAKSKDMNKTIKVSEVTKKGWGVR